MNGLREHLDDLYRQVDIQARLAADPVAFPRRYADPRDAEIVGLVAASFAFGRVDLFRPVLARIFAILDEHGGPRAFVDSFEPLRDRGGLDPIVYRWTRGPDVVLLLAALQGVLADQGSLESAFAGTDAKSAISAGVTALRTAAVAHANRCGSSAQAYGELPRGLRMLLASPEDGSACKRWNMYLRWMVRPPREGVDLGLWKSLSPSDLVIPLDTHVGRIARLVGLTHRRDNSWKTAMEVTEALRTFDSEDPIRFDFAIAHLGISGACIGRFHEEACPTCTLRPVCVAGLR